MKVFLVFLSLLSMSSFSKAQQMFPVDEETKQALVKEVLEVPGTTKTELYDRAIAWINKFYPNPTGVIQSKNAETGEIIGKAQFKLLGKDKKGVETYDGLVGYTITFSFKDGKFKYEISRIHWKQASYFDISKWMDKKDVDYNEVKYQYYLEQANTYFNSLKTELKKALITPPVKKKDDW